MQTRTVGLLAKQVWRNTVKNRSTIWLFGVFNLLLLCALLSGYQYMHSQQLLALENSEEVRERWVNNPDKHPHRMAHYGYVAFRQKYPLSFFDFGMDSYVGNVIFLEAHRQNTVNFSAASLSNGLLRLGEISAGMVLQLLVPLLLFFWGFSLVASEREKGTLKIVLIQNVSAVELIAGRALGLFYLSTVVFLPTAIIGGILLGLSDLGLTSIGLYGRFILLLIAYVFYFGLLSWLAVLISAYSSSSRASLIRLIGCWLFFTLMLPKVSQLVGQTLYPAPTKIEFDTAVEEELIQHGDSHNPNDPHFQALKDSLLRAYGVESPQELPFNYSGYVMREGEKLSAETYQRHQENLVGIYQKQQQVVRLTAMLNPYLAIKNLSMAFSGTDYSAFKDFQEQTETYRYTLAQTMNELQIQHISNKVESSADKKAIISRQHWEDLPDFQHQFLSLGQVIRQESISIISLMVWGLGLFLVTNRFAQHLKAF